MVIRLDYAKQVIDRARFSEDKMQKINLFETDQSFLDLYCLLPGQQQKAHTHAESDKYYYVLRGTGVFQLGDETFELAENSCCVARPGVVHGVKNTSDEPLIVLVMMAPKPNKH